MDVNPECSPRTVPLTRSRTQCTLQAPCPCESTRPHSTPTLHPRTPYRAQVYAVHATRSPHPDFSSSFAHPCPLICSGLPYRYVPTPPVMDASPPATLPPPFFPRESLSRSFSGEASPAAGSTLSPFMPSAGAMCLDSPKSFACRQWRSENSGGRGEEGIR